MEGYGISTDPYEEYRASVHAEQMYAHDDLSAPTCNDCHVPHDFLGKYTSKASNGFWHSAHFTLGATRCSVAGIAKGSGMIQPNMATMLAFLANV